LLTLKVMKILALHSNFIEYEPIEKEISDAEDAQKGKVRVDDLVVAFIAVEQDDDDIIASKAVEEIRSWLEKVKCNRLMLYPYAHLSSNLADAKSALRIINAIDSMLRKGNDIVVYKAPFGWTKAFTLSIKGHPLAEHSIHISNSSSSSSKSTTATVAVSQALQKEERLVSKWYILEPSGNRIPLQEYNFNGNESLKALADYEVKKRREVDEEPPHVRLMKRLAIADYEPASDAGNLRFYPKGRLIKSLIEQYVTRKVIEYGAVEVETPIMYDTKHPSLASYFNRFPARQYMIESEGKEFFLRFAACFGQFLMAKDFTISYKHLPLRIYELTRYSFRKEKSGELVGLRRLRAFTMPDCHALCKDIEQAKQEMIRRLELSKEVINELGIGLDNVEMAIRVTSDFYNENKEFIVELVRRFGKPALVEEWSERFFYFVLKWEFNFIDNLAKASALSTDQIDVENGSRYGIVFVDEQGNRRNPIILHNSPSGAVERVIYALLEKNARLQKEGKVPIFPLWLSATQVRLIPVNDSYMQYCIDLMQRIEGNQIRVDIDDREESVSKRIRDAELEWVPYIIVVGEKEILAKDTLNVRVRGVGVKNMSIDELIREIRDKVKDKPFMPLNMPKYISMRPNIMV
jgi:threonyl-tRNA synthetase